MKKCVQKVFLLWYRHFFIDIINKFSPISFNTIYFKQFFYWIVQVFQLWLSEFSVFCSKIYFHWFISFYKLFQIYHSFVRYLIIKKQNIQGKAKNTLYILLFCCGYALQHNHRFSLLCFECYSSDILKPIFSCLTTLQVISTGNHIVVLSLSAIGASTALLA